MVAVSEIIRRGDAAREGPVLQLLQHRLLSSIELPVCAQEVPADKPGMLVFGGKDWVIVGQETPFSGTAMHAPTCDRRKTTLTDEKAHSLHAFFSISFDARVPAHTPAANRRVSTDKVALQASPDGILHRPAAFGHAVLAVAVRGAAVRVLTVLVMVARCVRLARLVGEANLCGKVSGSVSVTRNRPIQIHPAS